VGAMKIQQLSAPPLPEIKLTYKQFYESGAFVQRELISASAMSSEAAKRGVRIMGFTDQFEPLDEDVAFQPVA
jgi:hypothetical protein